MNPLAWPDRLHLKAAEGWLELGQMEEAARELDSIRPDLRGGAVVLATRWKVDAALENWNACLDTAEAMVSLAPGSPTGWIQRAYALNELGRTKEAWDGLVRVAQRFPGNGTIAFNLACYACRLGDLD